MERQIPPARLFGVQVVRRLLTIWFLLLQYWASKWVNPMASGLPATLTSRGKVLAKNYEMQEGMRQFFAPFHHLCDPESCCCQPTEIIPYSTVDSVLYGVYPDSVRYSPIALPELLTAFLRENALPVRRYFKHYILGKTDDPQGEEKFQEPWLPCPALTAQGCSLPWGKRPAHCVHYICGRFLREMNWREHWRYAWLSGRYIMHLTFSLKLVIAEWRHQQGMYFLRTKAGEA